MKIARYTVIIDRELIEEDLNPESPRNGVVQLAKELQEAFDQGAAGNFKIVNRRVVDAPYGSVHQLDTDYQ